MISHLSHKLVSEEDERARGNPDRTYPEDQPGIPSVPTTSSMDVEETPGMSVVLVGHEDPHPPRFAGRPILHILLPDN